jgi:hypothetical protein
MDNQTTLPARQPSDGGLSSSELFGFLSGSTSEERNGVIPQPAPICATITPIQDRIQDAIGYAYELMDCTSPARHDLLLRQIKMTLTPLESELEEMRNQCANLRQWGEQWKRRAKMEQALNSLPNAKSPSAP